MFVQLRDFPDYLVNERGQVISLKFGKWREIAPQKDRYGYLHVRPSVRGRMVTKTVHRLVLEAFTGPHPLLQVNHKNGNKQDNFLDNLEWVTNSENDLHAQKLGLKNLSGITGPNHPTKKLSDEDLPKLLALKGRVARQDAAAQFGLSPHTVKDIWNGKRRSKGA